MESIQKDIRVEKVTKEVSCDYILPDFKGDIKKVLMCKAEATPTGKYNSDGRLEFTGIVNYSLLYADMENKITSAHFENDFSLNCQGEREAMDGMMDVNVCGISMRLYGPRKISVKATLNCDIKIAEENPLPEPNADEGIEPEILYESLDIATASISEGVEREYAEELTQIQSYPAESIEILTSGGNVFVSEAKAVDNGIELTGFYELYAIISTPDEPALAVSKRFRFTETVPINEETSQDIDILPSASITSLRFDVSDSDEGASVVASVITECCVGVFNNTTKKIAKDAVVPKHIEKCEFDDFGYVKLNKIEARALNVSGNLPRENEDAPSACQILCSHGRIKQISAHIEDREYKITGEMHLECITSHVDDSGMNVFGCEKFTAPFEAALPISYNVCDGANIDIFAKLRSVNIKLDRSSCHYEAEIGIKLAVLNKKHTSVLRSVSATKCEEGDDFTVTVIYPEKHETLWDIAKLTHTSPVAIAEKNALTASCLSDEGKQEPLQVKKLII